MENNAELDQLATEEAKCSGSVLFAKAEAQLAFHVNLLP